MKHIILLTTILLSSSVLAKKVKIGFLLSTLQEERYQKDKKFFMDKAKALGADVVFYASNNSERVQASKMENLLMKGVDVVVIQPVNSKAASNLVELAKESKIPVVAYDRIISNADLDAYVTQDSVEVGRLQAQAAVKKVNGKGNFILLKGQAGHSVANAISKGVKEVLAKYPKIKIIVEKYHDGWSPALAMNTVENALTKYKGNVAAIIANNSGMANGAVQAVLGHDKKLIGKVFIAGADADLTAVKNLAKGHQQFEVLKDIRPLAEKSVEIALQLAAGKKVQGDDTFFNGMKKVPVINTAVYPVTKEKIEEVIIARGFHKKEDIYGEKK